MEEKLEHVEEPHVDFTMQFNFAKNDERVEKALFNILKTLAIEISQGKENKLGALVVLGDFEKCPQVTGMLQMKPKRNPIEALRTVESESGIQCIKEFSKPPHDGAVIIDRSGQIVGAGVYLIVDDPTLDTPEDCGTRHKAAASFSLREDVLGVYTLSEETNIVRMWENGKLKEVFRVEQAEEDNQ